MKKRFLPLLLAFFVLFSVIPMGSFAAETTFTQTATGINCTRYTDYLVVYNSQHGTTTGTNAWGYEVTVTNGVVSYAGGNNSTIPTGDGSFVVSGHGTMADWLSANVTAGMLCTFNQQTKVLTFVDSETAPLYILDVARNEALAARDNAKALCYIYDSTADSQLSSLETRYSNIMTQYDRYGSFNETTVNTLAEDYGLVADLFRDTPVLDYRGVWIRPTQTTATQVDNYVQRCYDAGINMICLETMYACTTIMPMPAYSMFEHNPDFYGFDVLQAYINSCHSRGMELHVWMPVFYSGTTTRTYFSKSIAYKKPEWRSLTNHGSALYSNESSGMMFLSPANDEAVEHLLLSYRYILETYDIDGFQMDYIRYRDRTDTDDYGYDEATITKFKAAYPQYADTEITYNTNAEYWNDFMMFRILTVTDFVHKMRKLVNEVAPDVILSADVGPEPWTSYITLYQDSLIWLAYEWLDMIHPMAYGDGYVSQMKQFIESAGERCMVVPGLGIFMDEFDAEDMRRQTKSLLDTGCEGAVYFQIEQYLSKNCGDLLQDTIFTTRTTCPTLDNQETFNIALDRFEQRVDLAYNSGKISYTLRNNLISLSNTAQSAFSSQGAAESRDELDAVKSALDSVSNESLRAVFANDLEDATFAVVREENLVYADYTDYNMAIVDTSVLDESIYTPQSWAVLAEALALDVSGLLAKDQQKVDDATAAIYSAIEGLVIAEADYTEYNAAVETANSLVETDYTASSWNSLKSALAVDVSNIKKSDQYLLDSVTDSILAAIDSLSPVTADFSEYDKAVEQAGELNEAHYTAQTWATLETALAIKVDKTSSPLQSTVDAATRAIVNAMTALKELDADFTAYNQAVAEAEKLEESDYTPETWQILADALAVDISGCTISQQDQVDDATADINNAILGLEKAAPPVILGDIDGNGTFDGNDLVLARQVDATVIEIDQALLDAIEVSGDGRFDGADVVLMVQMDAGAITDWPING